MATQVVELMALGPIRVEHGGSTAPVAGSREATLLAALALHGGHVVTVDVLADAVWGPRPPRSARKTLQGFVHRLRRQLVPDAVLTAPEGYALGPTVTVDAERYGRLADRAGRLLASDRPEEAGLAAQEAMGLWRGRPFDELDGWTPSIGRRRHLEEVRAELEELEVACRLARGSIDPTVIAELWSLVATSPLREHRWWLLIEALRRADRRAEALRTYQQARQALIDEIGAEPGAALRTLYERLLRETAVHRVELARSEPGALMFRRPRTVVAVERSEPPPKGDERTLLTSYLQHLRDAIVHKVDGLTDDQAGTSHHPSTLTLAGLVKHLAFVEDSWIQETFAGRDLPDPWRLAPFDADVDWELHSAVDDPLSELVSLYRTAARRTDVAVASSSLDALAARPVHGGTVVSLRWILIHLIEETARHAGHADLIREALDGATGT